MDKVMLDFVPKFEQSQRIALLEKRNRELALGGKRKLYSGWANNLEGRVYGANRKPYIPAPDEEKIVVGDHACWIDIGPFPALDELPSRKDGYEMSCESWGRDYAFLLDHTPENIFPGEEIVGEIYWEMHMIRKYVWPEDIEPLRQAAREAGCGGTSSGHTCPDLMIGLTQGYGGILARIRASKAMYEKLDNPKKVGFLSGLEMICLSCIRFIKRYAALAFRLAGEATDENERARFAKIARCCERIAENPPETFYEAVQWIEFTVLFDRTVGHGNGYGMLDRYLGAFYDRDMAGGTLTRKEAREYVAEMFMKLRGHFFSVGGRDEQGNDATNEMSYVTLEAYDLVGDYNNLGVMWHPDMNPDFYAYACDVLARHGQSIPVLVNYDIMRDSELRNGIPPEDAWKVAYCGCQWYCIPGKEYCDQDVNTFVAVDPMKRALKRAAAAKTDTFEALYALFREELLVTAKALQALKRGHDQYLGELWPEMFTSLMSHGPIERGLDMVAPRGVDYQYTSVNCLGIPNASDSLYAVKVLVYEQARYALDEVIEATETNWEGREDMRLRFLNVEKYGNDCAEPDAMFKRVAEDISDVLGSLYNQKGQPFRPSLFHFQGHTAPTVIGATPDGRRATDYLAHGVNPTAGMNVRGLLPTANSLAATDLRKFQGAPLQVDLQPKFFDGKEELWKYVRDFSVGYFTSGGVQINLHVMDLEKLKDAMEHPEKPEYQNIVVRVTGYCARFVTLSRAYQEEFVSRVNYGSLQ